MLAERSQRPMAGKTQAQGFRLDIARDIYWQRLPPCGVPGAAPPRHQLGRGRRIYIDDHLKYTPLYRFGLLGSKMLKNATPLKDESWSIPKLDASVDERDSGFRMVPNLYDLITPNFSLITTLLGWRPSLLLWKMTHAS